MLEDIARQSRLTYFSQHGERLVIRVVHHPNGNNESLAVNDITEQMTKATFQAQEEGCYTVTVS